MLPKNVLIVEDEPALAEIIKIKFEKEGFIAVTVRTVLRALSYLEETDRVDAIWLDHYLLGKDNGLDFIVKLRGHDGKWERIPIFVVSNTADSEKKQAYLGLGVKKYYVKAEHTLDGIVDDIRAFLDHPEE